MGKSSQRSFYKLGPFRKFIFDINYWRTSVSGVSGLVYQTSPGIWQIHFPNNKISPPTMVALDAVELINSLWAHCPWQNSIANRLSRTQRHNPPAFLFEISKRWQLLLFGQSRLFIMPSRHTIATLASKVASSWTVYVGRSYIMAKKWRQHPKKIVEVQVNPTINNIDRIDPPTIRVGEFSGGRSSSVWILGLPDAELLGAPNQLVEDEGCVPWKTCHVNGNSPFFK